MINENNIIKEPALKDTLVSPKTQMEVDNAETETEQQLRQGLVEEYNMHEFASPHLDVFGDEYEGKAHKYDFNSFYPSVYSSDKFLIPIRPGRFCKISQDIRRFTYGIYAAKITLPDEEDKKIYLLIVFL